MFAHGEYVESLTAPHPRGYAYAYDPANGTILVGWEHDPTYPTRVEASAFRRVPGIHVHQSFSLVYADLPGSYYTGRRTYVLEPQPGSDA